MTKICNFRKLCFSDKEDKPIKQKVLSKVVVLIVN